MNIQLCIPHNYQVFNKQFVISLLGVVNSFYAYNAQNDNKHKLSTVVMGGWKIDSIRNGLVVQALNGETTHLMWLDTDMTFKPSVIGDMIELFEKDEKLDAVTGLYTWKKPPFKPHVYTSYNKEKGNFIPAAGFPLDEPFEVKGAGYGCLMIKIEVYNKVWRPWFEMKIENGHIVYGEDLFFFKKAQPIKMLCDPRILCSHLTEINIDITSYIDYNKLKVEYNTIILTDEQINEVGNEHKNKNS